MQNCEFVIHYPLKRVGDRFAFLEEMVRELCRFVKNCF